MNAARTYVYTRYENGEVALCVSGSRAHVAAVLAGKPFAAEALAAADRGETFSRFGRGFLFVVESIPKGKK